MKILHICLACFYIEGMGYQENLLPKFHAKKHKVTVITSDYAFDRFGKKTVDGIQDYYSKEGFRVIVFKKDNKFLHRLGYFEKLFYFINEIQPNIIFVHGGQFIGLNEVIKYCKKNEKVKLFIDNHSDYYNTPLKTIRRKILHKYIYGHFIRKSIRCCDTFWGVTPWRCEYLKEVYGVPDNKIRLLVMGGDPDKIKFDNYQLIRSNLRKKLKISDDDFVVISGGKISREKNIHILMQAISHLNKQIKLIIFGKPTNEMENIINNLIVDDRIINVGWLNSADVYDYFFAADLAFFPGTHSVLWEQSCASGIPAIFKRWPGMSHVDVGGNCLFLDDVNKQEIINMINNIYLNKELYESMKKSSFEKATKIFSYESISERAIKNNEFI